jgi:hypothetical protein
VAVTCCAQAILEKIRNTIARRESLAICFIFPSPVKKEARVKHNPHCGGKRNRESYKNVVVQVVSIRS